MLVPYFHRMNVNKSIGQCHRVTAPYVIHTILSCRQHSASRTMEADNVECRVNTITPPFNCHKHTDRASEYQVASSASPRHARTKLMTIEAGADDVGEVWARAREGQSQSITASKYGRWCGRGLDSEHRTPQ